MDDSQFMQILMVNIFELFKPSAARKNKIKHNLIDLEGKMRALYMISPRKPTFEEIVETVEYLEGKGYLKKAWIEELEYWSITPYGLDALEMLSHGEDFEL